MHAHSIRTDTAPRKVLCSRWNQAGSRVALNIMGHKVSYRDYICHGCGSNKEARAEAGVGGRRGGGGGGVASVSVAEVIAMLHKSVCRSPAGATVDGAAERTL